MYTVMSSSMKNQPIEDENLLFEKRLFKIME